MTRMEAIRFSERDVPGFLQGGADPNDEMMMVMAAPIIHDDALRGQEGSDPTLNEPMV